MGAGYRQSRLATVVMDMRELKGLFLEFGSRWPAHPAVGDTVLFVNKSLADVLLFSKNPDLDG